MSIGYQMAKPNNPVLREVIPEHDFLAPTLGGWNLHAVASNLWLTMRKGNEFDTGIGIAAPQVGIRLRMFVLHLYPTKQPFNKATVCINPKVLATHNPPTPFVERCLTWPGRDVTVLRSDHITVEYTDMRGKLVTKDLHGVLARAYQHELDHLNGKCIL